MTPAAQRFLLGVTREHVVAVRVDVEAAYTKWHAFFARSVRQVPLEGEPWQFASDAHTALIALAGLVELFRGLEEQALEAQSGADVEAADARRGN